MVLVQPRGRGRGRGKRIAENSRPELRAHDGVKGKKQVRPQYCGIGVGLLLLVLVWSGCQSTPSAYDESPAPLQESAPTAREMEASLSPSGQEALPAVSNGHHAEGSSREVVARAIPPVRKHPSPIVDEALTMSNGGIAWAAPFPGVAEVESEGRHQRIIINDDQSIEKAPLPVYPEEAASRPEVAPAPAPAPAPPVSPPASEELLAPPAPQAASAETAASRAGLDDL